jgi:hypothetical protein
MGKKELTVQARALLRAAAILGGKQRLRAALHVPMTRLDEWLEGIAERRWKSFYARSTSLARRPASRRARRRAGF